LSSTQGAKQKNTIWLRQFVGDHNFSPECDRFLRMKFAAFYFFIYTQLSEEE
jgi:hypothetical protein